LHWRLSLNVLRTLIPATILIFGSLCSAGASTISLGSYATTAANSGFDNSATAFAFAASTVNTGSTATYNVDSGNVWHSALGQSSYVSFASGTGPTGTFAPPNGDYVYTSTFNATGTNSGTIGTLTVLADDTVSIYLNNVLILASAGAMGPGNSYGMCSDVGPNCITPLTFTFTGILEGANLLTFDVKQVNSSNEGLDYVGAITTVPEPASLALLGTGMLTMCGFMKRFVKGK
jgi:hypothetical protein